jgi:hypothetical protein
MSSFFYFTRTGYEYTLTQYIWKAYKSRAQ